ncbi:hypothetical protein G6F59_014269 [Rhizopus arrhizus]|nr:hypothetical protein G6F59_014269 [Rhizopus arrhizus]
MRQPGLAGLRVLADREAVYEAGLRRPAIPVRQHAHLQAGAGAFEFGRQLACGAAERLGLGRVIGVGIAELHHEVVLRTVDAGAVPEVFVGEGPDVGDMARGELRRQFDDHPASRQVHVQQVGRVRRAPVAGRRRVEDLLRAAVGRGRVGQRGQQAGQGEGGQGKATAVRHGNPGT